MRQNLLDSQNILQCLYYIVRIPWHTNLYIIEVSRYFFLIPAQTTAIVVVAAMVVIIVNFLTYNMLLSIDCRYLITNIVQKNSEIFLTKEH